MDGGTDTGSELNGWVRRRTLIGLGGTYRGGCLIRSMSYSFDNCEGGDKDDDFDSSIRVRVRSRKIKLMRIPSQYYIAPTEFGRKKLATLS
jgi:hypothetical protein